MYRSVIVDIKSSPVKNSSRNCGFLTLERRACFSRVACSILFNYVQYDLTLLPVPALGQVEK